MTHLRHLVAHDVRLHWPLIAAWVAIVLAHPLVAAVPWSEDALASARLLGAGLVGSRVLVGAAVLATLVQADSPIDDRGFWRTRPIAPATMAVAKLVVVCLVFVVVPLLVVLAVAAAVHVPRQHWPATVLGVVLGEMPGVMLTAVIAARTRRASTALVGLAGVVALLLLIVAVAGQAVIQLEPRVRRVDPFTAPVPLAIWLTTCLTVLAGAAWWGARARAVLVVGTTVGVLGLLALWLVPTIRSVSMTSAAGGRPPVLTRLDTRRVAGSRVRVAAVVSHSFAAGTHVLMEHATVAIGGRRALEPFAMPAAALLASPTERAFTVADLSEGDALAMQGQPVRITGQLVTLQSHRTTDARARLVAGARLDGARVRGLIEQVRRPTEDVPVVAHVSVLSLSTAIGLVSEQPQLATALRDVRTQERHQLTHAPRKVNDLVSLVQLPVFARPFAVHHLSLRVRIDELSAIDPAASQLELDVVDISTSFTEVAGSLPLPALSVEARP